MKPLQTLLPKAILTAALLAAALAPTAADASLTVTPALTVVNKCPKSIVIAVRYKASSGNWETTNFIGMNGGDRKERIVSTSNSVIYYYAETMSETNRTVWSGDHNVTVEGKTYAMKRQELAFNAEHNRFVMSLTCG